MKKQCKICGEIPNFLKTHLKVKHNMTDKEYYDTYIEPNTEHICLNENCNNKTNYKNLGNGYTNFCCLYCVQTSNHVKEVIQI